MRKAFLVSAVGCLGAVTIASPALSGKFMYRHNLPGAAAAATATNKPPVLTSTNETLSLEVGATAIPFATTELSDPENDTLVVTVTLDDPAKGRSEEHTSELQSLMRISYAVFCLKKKIQTN